MKPEMTKSLPWLPSAAIAVIAAPAWAHAGGADNGSWFHHAWGWGWGHMLFGALFMFLFWGGLILLIVLAVRWFGRDRAVSGEAPDKAKSAREILDERFARGDIDRNEYEERKRLLSE